ncbi:ParA family protein [Pseudomonas syringae]|uniref:ParA family protein n=1 Tax=Pseudomonas syringae TaxID=317 RepID=UPI001F15C3B8|nr:ParA family protein [Pseudomonas syringae]MCF5733990.1 AAA family ATPase [Pseudomonas syringae]MCF5737749.1 AAA family ATPase [Pseudomonas syringae]MCF5749150.1 AAA family ATPase [Pseudomonas syringae]MCF5754062.1 AAA family ATPase [Pseudomonas syringae]
MLTYSFWNNKGGTGKTSLVFQTVCTYAEQHPNEKVLVIDLCPQANLSEILLGGQENSGNRNLMAAHGRSPRCSIGGYFEVRLPSPFSAQGFNSRDYVLNPNQVNSSIAGNIDLICGDPLLELQAIAMNTLANANLPGVNTWLAVIDWLNDLLAQIRDEYDVVFIDTNPSFSMYTQIALAASQRVVLPVMADDSSRRAVQNALSLIYGIRLPSPIYARYTFSSQMQNANRPLPQIHLVVRNRITQYMGDASAYQAVLDGISQDLDAAIMAHPQHFTFNNSQDGLISVRDFQTTGVVSFARGCPFTQMPSGKLTLSGQRVQVKREYLDNSIEAIVELTARI